MARPGSETTRKAGEHTIEVSRADKQARAFALRAATDRLGAR